MKGERASHEGACWVIIHSKNQILASLTVCWPHFLLLIQKKLYLCFLSPLPVYPARKSPTLTSVSDCTASILPSFKNVLKLKALHKSSKGFIPYFNNSIFLGYSIVINNSEYWCSLHMVWLGGPDKTYLPWGFSFQGLSREDLETWYLATTGHLISRGWQVGQAQSFSDSK